ncbi:hypothetical protein BJ875DRAFT_440163 [Amylocarpus encephaloides]|uniref:Uncharacterized protein n=1 Tax=Amylocarpus encephaloides TaxID=45428 RepID=A0A9P7YLZ6_9HELO|nr:hypothetical protein BJ875DRAFT_440163 [Amylocarpus encephaloides]
MPETHLESNDLEYEDFSCPFCFRTISSDRPPIFNSDNCSCVEAAMVINGSNGTNDGPSSFEQPLYSPESCASSSPSTRCPEGPETTHPNLHLSDSCLPLCPPPSPNEHEHASTSSKLDLSYQLRRYLIEQEATQYPSPSPSPEPSSPFPRQELHVQLPGSMMVGKSSKRSKQSKKSLKSSSSGELGYSGYGADPTVFLGTWAMEREGGGRLGEEYPLEMSGVSEFAFHE